MRLLNINDNASYLFVTQANLSMLQTVDLKLSSEGVLRFFIEISIWIFSYYVFNKV